MTDRITLIGHSGCKLQVRQSNSVLITTKTSKEVSYNNRLQVQAQKQASYSSILCKTPTVYDAFINKEGLYEFHMEYINGKTLANALHELPLYEIKAIAKKLLAILDTQTTKNPESHNIFLTKIQSLEDTMPSDVPSIVLQALKHLRKVDWSLCEEGYCHGDLTLENIIVRNNEFYLIDFLDSFFNSWIIDAAKLFQDLECLWSYRNEPLSENLQIRILAIKKILLSHIRSRSRGDTELMLIYNVLLLNLLRILPYTHDIPTKKYLYNEINRLMSNVRTQDI